MERWAGAWQPLSKRNPNSGEELVHKIGQLVGKELRGQTLIDAP
jgi:hypothetical protein